MHLGLNNELETLNCLYFKYANQKRLSYALHILLLQI